MSRSSAWFHQAQLWLRAESGDGGLFEHPAKIDLQINDTPDGGPAGKTAKGGQLAIDPKQHRIVAGNVSTEITVQKSLAWSNQ